MQPIPALRDDLEVTRRPDGQVDVRDPRLLNVFTLDASYLEVALHFDGERGAKQVVEAHRLADKKRVKSKYVLEVAEELDALYLLDTEEAAEATPSVENTAPHALLESVSRRLRVIPDAPPSSAWSCQACGACCHGLVVELTEAEEARIDADLYADVLDGEDFALDAFVDPEIPARRVLRQRMDDGHACVFLGSDGLCLVHSRQGPEAKPDACQIFPYMVVHVPGRTPHLAMRTNCKSMHESWETGAKAETAIPDVKRLLRTHDSLLIPRRSPWFGKDKTPDQLERLFRKVQRPFAEEGITPEALVAADRALQGRVGDARARFGAGLLQYLREETRGPAPVEEGGLKDHLRPVPRVRVALKAMSKGDAAPRVKDPVARSSLVSSRSSFTASGPSISPDAGLGTVALLLAMEAALHALGPKGSLAAANATFMGLTAPLLENTAHAWPILEAVDPGFTRALRAEYAAAIAG